MIIFKANQLFKRLQMPTKSHLVSIFLAIILIINVAEQKPNTDTRFFTWRPEYMETEFDSPEDTSVGEDDPDHDHDHDHLVHEFGFASKEQNNKEKSGQDYSNSNPDSILIQKTKLLKECYKNALLYYLGMGFRRGKHQEFPKIFI